MTLGYGIPLSEVRSAVSIALAEDVGYGDVTTLVTVRASTVAAARIVAEESGIVAGIPAAIETFNQVDPNLRIEVRRQEGSPCEPGTILMEMEGAARSILTGERIALNFLQRLSGIATLTNRYVEAAKPYPVRIVNTRKTTPGLRALERYAVLVGGGENHRFGLFDAVLIKDNHILASGSITKAVESARKFAPHTMTITVECESLAQVDEAIASRPDIILLDNMDADTLKIAVEKAHAACLKVEVSGGIELDAIPTIAVSGADIISVGALTHSAPSLDISMDLHKVRIQQGVASPP
ncbi:MAG: carboxylating nicotinate-nucleotide diphosphorylase [Armatimonadetes bacterium]|nr:carboxylating nicotinate-nucleotide diphosphorylase [Armatimonadota bacterium]